MKAATPWHFVSNGWTALTKKINVAKVNGEGKSFQGLEAVQVSAALDGSKPRRWLVRWRPSSACRMPFLVSQHCQTESILVKLVGKQPVRSCDALKGNN